MAERRSAYQSLPFLADGWLPLDLHTKLWPEERVIKQLENAGFTEDEAKAAIKRHLEESPVWLRTYNQGDGSGRMLLTTEHHAAVKRIHEGTSNEKAEVDLLTTDQLSTLAGVGKGRFHNVLSCARTSGDSDLPSPAIKGSGSRNDQYSYAAMRPFLLRKWPTRQPFFPGTFADVKAFLSEREQRK